jgi:DNA topoisomerase-1
MMLDLDSKLKKKKGADFFALDEDLDDEWIKQHQAELLEEQRQKIQKRFEKDNEKRVAEGENTRKSSRRKRWRPKVAESLSKSWRISLPSSTSASRT